MTIDGKLGTASYGGERARGHGHAPVILSGKVKADQGTLPVGLIVTKDANALLVPYAEVADEVLGTGEAAATAVADEVMGAGDGSVKIFHGALANGDAEPGSVAVEATVGAATVAMSDDGAGGLAGAAGAGTINYATGVFSLIFGTAPDNSTNVTADYNHTPPAKTFSGTLADGPVEPGSVVVTDGVEAFSDDGLGVLTGDAGGAGTIDYATGAISVTFNAAVVEDTDVEVSYVTAVDGVLDEPVDTTKNGSGIYIPHGSVRQDVLKVGASSPADPDVALLGRLNAKGIYPA